MSMVGYVNVLGVDETRKELTIDRYGTQTVIKFEDVGSVRIGDALRHYMSESDCVIKDTIPLQIERYEPTAIRFDMLKRRFVSEEVRDLVATILRTYLKSKPDVSNVSVIKETLTKTFSKQKLLDYVHIHLDIVLDKDKPKTITANIECLSKQGKLFKFVVSINIPITVLGLDYYGNELMNPLNGEICAIKN